MSPLSFSGRRWQVLQDLRHIDPAGVDPAFHVLRSIAAQRRFGTLEELLPQADEQPGVDAAVFPGLPAAVERIHRAVRCGERVGLFGDYDCDGVTSAAQMLRYLQRHRVDPVVRLPHRVHDGYGLKARHVEEFLSAGVTLLITVDTGISCAAEVTMAKARGLDVIIADHHHVPAVVPDAVAILHPALSEAFPGAHPAAAGVVWSLVCALERAHGTPHWEGRQTDLALAAIGTVADLVELKGTNRTLVRGGLAALRGQSGTALGMLMEMAGIQGAPTSRDIAFRIAPRLNAAGRLADPVIALQALLGDAAALVELDRLNTERQSLLAGVLERALASMHGTQDAFVCAAMADCPPGVAGLLASKLADTFGRPSLVASIQGEQCIASLRSVPGYDVTEALKRQHDLLTSFGGHAQAAGCTFPLAAWEQLRARLHLDADERILPEHRSPLLLADAAMDHRLVTLELCRQMQLLEPFGQGNAEPRFLLSGIRLEDPRGVGREAAHLQARIGGVKAIGFHLGHLQEQILGPVDVLGRIGIDTWQGRATAQVFIDDIREAVVTETAATVEATTIVEGSLFR